MFWNCQRPSSNVLIAKRSTSNSIAFGGWYEFLKRALVLSLILLLVTSQSLSAQQKKLSSEGSVVDVVSLKSGKSLRGIIVSQESKADLAIVVQRDWLASANPSLSTTVLEQNQQDQQSAWRQTRDRISDRLKSPMRGPHLKFFLQTELERLDKLIAEKTPETPEFLWVDVRHQTIAKVQRALPDRQRIALFAWGNQLKNVETRDAVTLRKQLTELKIDLDSPAPDLTSRLAARRQDEQEWMARMAIVEYTLETPLDFQGMGDTFVRTEQGKPIDLGEVLPKLIQQQLGSVLSELTADFGPAKKRKGDSRWWSTSIPAAERESASGFRVTRLELAAETSMVDVETAFVARVGDGNWKAIWSKRETADASKDRPQAEAQIQQDPQLKSAVEAVESLGLSKQALKQAIRAGAATMHSQREADGAFSEFRSRYTQRLDGPPLFLESKKP